MGLGALLCLAALWNALSRTWLGLIYLPLGVVCIVLGVPASGLAQKVNPLGPTARHYGPWRAGEILAAVGLVLYMLSSALPWLAGGLPGFGGRLRAPRIMFCGFGGRLRVPRNVYRRFGRWPSAPTNMFPGLGRRLTVPRNMYPGSGGRLSVSGNMYDVTPEEYVAAFWVCASLGAVALAMPRMIFRRNTQVRRDVGGRGGAMFFVAIFLFFVPGVFIVGLVYKLGFAVAKLFDVGPFVCLFAAGLFGLGGVLVIRSQRRSLEDRLYRERWVVRLPTGETVGARSMNAIRTALTKGKLPLDCSVLPAGSDDRWYPLKKALSKLKENPRWLVREPDGRVIAFKEQDEVRRAFAAGQVTLSAQVKRPGVGTYWRPLNRVVEIG